MQSLPDPCPMPDKEKKKTLHVKERLIYAPMSGVGGVIYDKDAVYIDLGGSHSLKQNEEVVYKNNTIFKVWILRISEGVLY